MSGYISLMTEAAVAVTERSAQERRLNCFFGTVSAHVDLISGVVGMKTKSYVSWLSVVWRVQFGLFRKMLTTFNCICHDTNTDWNGMTYFRCRFALSQRVHVGLSSESVICAQVPKTSQQGCVLHTGRKTKKTALLGHHVPRGLGAAFFCRLR